MPWVCIRYFSYGIKTVIHKISNNYTKVIILYGNCFCVNFNICVKLYALGFCHVNVIANKCVNNKISGIYAIIWVLDISYRCINVIINVVECVVFYAVFYIEKVLFCVVNNASCCFVGRRKLIIFFSLKKKLFCYNFFVFFQKYYLYYIV